MSDPIRPVGLLAGSGRFPIVFAEKARQLGIPVVCVGIRNEASPELAELVSRFENHQFRPIDAKPSTSSCPTATTAEA